MNDKDNLIKLIETMEKDISEILKNLNSPDHIRKYATCLVLDICHLRLIAENEYIDLIKKEK